MAYLEHAYPEVPPRTTVAPAPRRGKVWTIQDRNTLMLMAFDASNSLEKIAVKLNRTPCAVRVRMTLLYAKFGGI